MEFPAPITVSSITDEFPGHGIFQSHDGLFCKPLGLLDELEAGQSYFLLPLNNQPQNPSASSRIGAVVARDNHNRTIRQSHLRSRSVPTTPSYPPPYRMSLDYQHHLGVRFLKKTSTEPYSCRSSTSKSSISRASSKSSRFWKVRLVITPQQLMEILSQEARTKELIESVRIVAKCGVAAGGILPASATASIVSDQWSLSSSGRSACDSSKIDALVV